MSVVSNAWRPVWGPVGWCACRTHALMSESLRFCRMLLGESMSDIYITAFCWTQCQELREKMAGGRGNKRDDTDGLVGTFQRDLVCRGWDKYKVLSPPLWWPSCVGSWGQTQLSPRRPFPQSINNLLSVSTVVEVWAQIWSTVENLELGCYKNVLKILWHFTNRSQHLWWGY